MRLSTNNLSGVSFVQSAGVLDLNGKNITTTGVFTVNNGTPATFANLGGSTITVGGAASLNGQAGNLLDLNPGSSWTIAATGALTATYATIANSNSSHSTGSAANSVNGGSNTNWIFPGNITWTNGAGDGKWGTPGNWSNGLVPTKTDTAVFGSTCTASCQLNISDTVYKLVFNAGYTGTFDFHNDTLSILNNADFRNAAAITSTGALRFIGTLAQIFYPQSSNNIPGDNSERDRRDNN